MSTPERRPRRSIVSPKAIGIILALVVAVTALLGYWFFVRDDLDGSTISSQDLQAQLAMPITTTQSNDAEQNKSEDSCVHNLTYPGFTAAKEHFYDWTWMMLGLPRDAADEKTDPYVVAYMRDVYDTGIQNKFSDNPEEVISFTITYCIPP